MQTKKFATNINCRSCLRTVTPFLNEVEGIENWSVDVNVPEKVLTVDGAADEQTIIKAVEEAGFDVLEVMEVQ